MKKQILAALSPAYPWKDHFYFYDSLGSTNDEARILAKQGAPHGTVLIAGHQSCGHGRMGRSFHSPEGVGVYLTMILRPACTPDRLMHLTCATAVAMCNAVEAATGLRPGIKWTNDLVHGKRKLGGILTALGLSPKGMVDFAIIGIGVNCCQQPEDFPEEIRDMAGSLSMATGQEINRAKVAAAMMEALWQMDKTLLSGVDEMLNRYRSDCITLHQDVVLVRGEEKRYGHAVDIDSAGALVVRFADGHLEAVNSGEISVRGMYGYT